MLFRMRNVRSRMMRYCSCHCYRADSSLSMTRTNYLFSLNSAITHCFSRGDVEGASQLFDEMPHRNLITWNCMISGYVRNHMIVQAQKVFDAMPAKNIVSWTALLTGYAKCGRLEDARILFDEIPRKNVVCWNSMVSGYLTNGRVTEARKLFDEMPMRNNASWAIMIQGYLRHKLVAEARSLFDQSPSRSISIYNALLSGYVDLGRYGDAEELFAQMIERNAVSRNAVSWNTMITCYSRHGKMEAARRLFEDMQEKDVISWTAVIHGYLQNGDITAAWDLFERMPGRDIMAWNTMMGGFVQNGMLEDALSMFSEMPERDIVSWNTILQGYVHQGDMGNARSFFEKMPCRSETSWNTLISGYRSEEALVLLCRMVQEGFDPDQATLSVVISVCASLVALGWGRMMHCYASRAGYDRDTLVMSSLISMYSRCGLVGDADQVFKVILKHDTIAWNAMIAAYAYHGFALEATKLYEEMIRASFRPDQVTFMALLSACAHNGLVDEGCQHFNSMQKDWELIPKPEHYSCVVDLLGRSGLIGQAHDFINKIPVELQGNAWETLFSACRFHGSLEFGEIAAKRVLHAQPFDGGMYIILANIYAAKGLWKDATGVRALMKARGVKKQTGCSWIEVKGKMCSFVSNDKSYPFMEAICKELDNLSRMME